MTVVAVIENPEVIRRILQHLGLWLANARPTPRAHSPPGLRPLPGNPCRDSYSQLLTRQEEDNSQAPLAPRGLLNHCGRQDVPLLLSRPSVPFPQVHPLFLLSGIRLSHEASARPPHPLRSHPGHTTSCVFFSLTRNSLTCLQPSESTFLSLSYPLVLAGQSDLRRVVEFAVMEPFNQRIAMRYHLPPLSLEETKQYVTHHLKLAGAPEPLLDPQTLEAVHEVTFGIPRKIGLAVEQALTYALFDQKRSVTAEMVLKVKNLEG